MAKIEDFSGYAPTWCPGCGDWGIGAAVKTGFQQLGFDPSSVFVVFGIGCSGNMNDFLNAYAIHALHGRAMPNAIGMKLANHKMPIVLIVGDGDFYGEGGNHFLHACRGNHDITVIVHDNGVYGLTTGQVAPTAPQGMKSKSTPAGIIETPVYPLSLALTQGATFVAQSFAGDLNHMIDTIKKGITHKGFSLINILQPCVTFNKVNTYQYYLKNSYKLDANHDVTNYQKALEKATGMNNERFPLGILYQIEKPVFHEQVGILHDGETLIARERFSDYDSLFDEFI
ncbi:2-oxoacid:ferredoxin oxidoreductase subunit beta [Candidatus Roizmanbacteria bacterium]|nr:2-oxoacid:ferredoxin oxidoreductase subunit beta [Candidatus Roizmanbacteria bacterium]